MFGMNLINGLINLIFSFICRRLINLDVLLWRLDQHASGERLNTSPMSIKLSSMTLNCFFKLSLIVNLIPSLYAGRTRLFHLRDKYFPV